MEEDEGNEGEFRNTPFLKSLQQHKNSLDENVQRVTGQDFSIFSTLCRAQGTMELFAPALPFCSAYGVF